MIKNKFYHSHKLVKSEDLNHHGSLFAGRTAEWFVESGFIAVAHVLNPKHVICLKIHDMLIQKVVRVGEILCFTSKIVKIGKTSIVVYTKISKESCDETVVEGFATFIHVDENSQPTPHNLEIGEIEPELLEKLNDNLNKTRRG